MDKRLTDIFIRTPVLSIVISLAILVLGARSLASLSVQQYPTIESAVITVQTAFTGASPDTVAAFITTPLEEAIAQANGIDYMTSNSTQNLSNIQVNLLLNYDYNAALTQIMQQINSVVNQLPSGSQLPTLTINVGSSIASMYIGFNSDTLPENKITDYLLRTVQPKLQAINGVQQATVLGNSQIALRVWLDPKKLAGYGITTAEVGQILSENNFVSAAGRTDGQTFILNLNTDTALTDVDQFENMIIKSENGAIIRIKDVGTVSLGQQNYNTSVTNAGKPAVFISIQVAPNANLLTVLGQVKKTFTDIQTQMPNGLNGQIVYDSSLFVDASIDQVNEALFEAFLIVTAVVYLFLGSFRALVIPVLAIPLSIIGTFFIMLMLGYSINLLTLLAMVLAIGLVVDDAIIVVENVSRHMEEGKTAFQAAILSARELTKPIVAISIVLIAVYLPIGFMGGITGALFTEFAFSLAGSVGISAIIALTLSPMMCSKMLKHAPKPGFINWFDKHFDRFRDWYHQKLVQSLGHLHVVIVFAVIILLSNLVLFMSSQSELAPQEDQGIIMTMLTADSNSSLDQTSIYSKAVSKIFSSYSATQTTFQVNGFSSANSAPNLNLNLGGMVLKNWDDRKETSNQLQPEVQQAVGAGIPGATVAVFQLPSLPGGGSGLPVQFVIQSTQPLSDMYKVANQIVAQAQQTGKFTYVTTDLYYNMQQDLIHLNRDKIAEFGLTMQDVGNAISAALSENYINYFNYMGRTYQVIPQMIRQNRLNPHQLLDYYINTADGKPISLATVASIKDQVAPQSVNHFQQLNSVTVSANFAPGVTQGSALETLQKIAAPILPQGYTIDYASQSRQYMEQGSTMITTFALALIIIYLALAVLFNSFRDPVIVLISVPMSICGAMIFISMGIGGATLNIYTEVGLVTLIGLISKHGILLVEFANDLQKEGVEKFEAITQAALIRFRPILMTTGAMVLGVIPLIRATGAGAESRFNIGLVIATGISIGTCFTLFVVPAMYMLIAKDYKEIVAIEEEVPE